MRQAVGRKQRWGIAGSLAGGLLLLCPWPLAAFKPAARPPAAPPMRIEVGGQATEEAHPPAQVGIHAPSQRQIVDPCLGIRWQLVADTEHPERPGHLVPVNSGANRAHGPAGPASSPAAFSIPLQVIRAGDRVDVSQQTPILRARFQAVALESAAAGQTFRARLLNGAQTLTGNQGAVVDVRAIRAGEAFWLAVDRNSQ